MATTTDNNGLTKESNRRGRRLLLLLAGVVAAALAGVGAWRLFQPSQARLAPPPSSSTALSQEWQRPSRRG